MDCPLAASSALALMAALTFACAEPPGIEERFNEPLVITSYDHNTQFANFSTFSIVDNVPLATVLADSTVTTSSLDPAQSAALIARVAQNLTDRGYTQVGLDQNPSFGVGLGAVLGLSTASVAGQYWGNYYGSYWGSPGTGTYYPYSINYTYRTGSLVIEVTDLQAPAPVGAGAPSDAGGADAGTALRAVWTSIAYQALADGAIDVVGVGLAIDQAFQQSPYFRR